MGDQGLFNLSRKENGPSPGAKTRPSGIEFMEASILPSTCRFVNEHELPVSYSPQIQDGDSLSLLHV